MADDPDTGVGVLAMDAAGRSTYWYGTPRDISGRRFPAVDRASWHPPLTDAQRTSLD